MNHWLDIDLKAIRHNIRIIKKEIAWPKVKFMAVVKSNAYGHGIVEVSKVCQVEKVDYLAVATPEEALNLRSNKIVLPILILGYVDKENLASLIKQNITLSVYDRQMISKISRICRKIDRKVKVHLKLDTGMHRLGFLPDDFVKIYKEILKNKWFEVEYLYSHFADIKNKSYIKEQLKVLNQVLEKLRIQKLPIPKIHFCRSDALNDEKTFFDMIRPGLALYGLSHSILNLKPALSFKTRIVQVKRIKKGDYIGYCLSYKAPTYMTIATIAIGYADGYSRDLSNCGEVLIRGKRCSVIGQVCMNLAIVDVGAVKNPQVGDLVVLIGRSGQKEITVEELALKTGTITYEIVSRIPAEIPRIYK